MDSKNYRLKHVSEEFKTDILFLNNILLDKGYFNYPLQPLEFIGEEAYNELESRFAYDLAIRRIKKCIELKSTNLDIGNCNLTDNDFREETAIYGLFQECQHVETITFSSEWVDYDNGNLVESINKRNSNSLSRIPAVLIFLGKLKKLILSGSSKSSKIVWTIQDLTPLQFLPKLRYLDISRNSIVFLEYLNVLSQLEVLDLSQNYIISMSGLN